MVYKSIYSVTKQGESILFWSLLGYSQPSMLIISQSQPLTYSFCTAHFRVQNLTKMNCSTLHGRDLLHSNFQHHILYIEEHSI